MKLKHHLIEPTKENPFKDCKLNREKYADVLTGIVNAYSDGFVMSINSDWGTGKTTFVRMWQMKLKADEYPTIYFNAWENDFSNNPLVALISEFETLKKSSNSRLFKAVLKKGSVFARKILPSIAEAAANKYIGPEVVKNIVKDSTDASLEILEEEIKDYTSKKKTIKEFRIALEKYIKSASKEKPLIFIIDELDRCRPSYSVEVLEQIKHLFSVQGIVFVLSIDKDHLAAAIKGVYGSSEINTTEYLRRFIDYEYFLPTPNYSDSLYYFYEYFEIPQLMEKQSNLMDFHIHGTGMMVEVFVDSMKQFPLSLRQQEQLFANVRLVVSLLKNRGDISVPFIFFLMRWKISELNGYQKMCSAKLSIQQLCDEFEKIYRGPRNFEFVINNLSMLLALYPETMNSQDATDFSVELLLDELSVSSYLNNNKTKQKLSDRIKILWNSKHSLAGLKVYVNAIDHVIINK